jgi:hypothetical protein
LNRGQQETREYKRQAPTENSVSPRSFGVLRYPTRHPIAYGTTSNESDFFSRLNLPMRISTLTL